MKWPPAPSLHLLYAGIANKGHGPKQFFRGLKKKCPPTANSGSTKESPIYRRKTQGGKEEMTTANLTMGRPPYVCETGLVKHLTTTNITRNLEQNEVCQERPTWQRRVTGGAKAVGLPQLTPRRKYRHGGPQASRGQQRRMITIARAN